MSMLSVDGNGTDRDFTEASETDGLKLRVLSSLLTSLHDRARDLATLMTSVESSLTSVHVRKGCMTVVMANDGENNIFRSTGAAM